MKKKKSRNQGHKFYCPDEEIDSVGIELARLSKEMAFRQEKQRSEYRKTLRDGRNTRIAASKEDKYAHAIGVLVEYANLEISTIPFSSFNFEDVTLFRKFLETLQSAGCFRSWQTNPYKDNDHSELIFRDISVPALNLYRSRHLNSVEECVRCENYTFELFKRDKTLVFSIDFHPRNGKTTDTYSLMRALSQYLQRHGQHIDGWFEVVVPRKFIFDFIRTNMPEQHINGDKWIENTKHNLRQKIPENARVMMRISNFDRDKAGYPFSVKID